MAPLTLYLSALRPFAYPASVLSVLVGTAAAAGVREWKWGVLLAEVTAVVLLHSVGNLLNDYFDFRSGVDHREEGDEGRPGRYLVKGTLRPRDYLLLAGLCSGLFLPVGAFLVARGGWPILALGLAGLLGGYAYTGVPFALKYRGLGELCIFLVFGPAIVAGACYMQRHIFEPHVMLYSLPIGLAITSIVSANFLRDSEEDAAAGIRTLPQVLGRRRYLAVYLALLLAPPAIIAGMVLTGSAPAWTLLVLLSLPLVLPPARCAVRNERRHDADAMTAKYVTAFGALLTAGLIVAGW